MKARGLFRQPAFWGGAWLAVMAAALLLVREASGQNNPKRIRVAPPIAPATPSEDEDTKPVDENVFLAADRGLLQKLSGAQKLIAEGRPGEAARHLGEILEALAETGDFFPPPDIKLPAHRGRGLRSEAERLIGKLPPQGRELYELQYGPQARQMVDEALKLGDAPRLAEVSRRFFHTRSGYQAALLLGLHCFDSGQPEMAAEGLQRLRDAGQFAEEDFEPTLSLTLATCWLQAGSAKKARECLASLRQRQPTARLVVAGAEVPAFSGDADAVDWLAKLLEAQPAARRAEDWPMFRGDATRNAASLGSAPLLNLRWQVAAPYEPLPGTDSEQYDPVYTDRAEPTLPPLHPLVVGDLVLMRTSRSLLAVDFVTGKRLWKGLEGGPGETTRKTSDNDPQAWQQTPSSSAEERMRKDLTYGTLSSDGQYVFAVEDSPAADQGRAAAQPANAMRGWGRFQPDPRSEQQVPHNRLAAYEIRTRVLKWQLGGPAGKQALRQADTFFLGPPLPLTGQLYVLAEAKGEIRLLVLEAATGNLLWSQQLAVTEQNVLQNPLRRWAGGSPSYADGILVCPTSAGAIVAIDLASRSLVWGYQYGQDPDGSGRGRGPGMFFRSRFSGGQAARHWADAAVCIVDDRVLATPVESDSLHCLRLTDGRLLWKSPRYNDLYLACVDQGKAVLVGRSAVRALRLAGGQRAWGNRIIDLPEDCTPSGRGFLADRRYFLPLSNATVAAIDLNAGKIVQVSKSRNGSMPGNLICYRGHVLSLGLEGMEAYYQLDGASAEISRRLNVDPDDPEALSLRGEVLWDSGKRAEAIASFRRAYELKVEPRTRELLRESLLEGLQTDFAAHRDRREELERLLDNPSQQAAYLRLMACGLQKAEELEPAFDYCQKLIDLEPDRLPLDQIDKNLFVRRDRWVQNRLAELRRKAGGELAAKIDAAVEARLKAALADGSLHRLQQFFDYFDGQTGAAPGRGELLARLITAGRSLEAELLGKQWPEAQTPEDAGRQRPAGSEAVWPMGKVEISSAQPAKDPANNLGRQFSVGLQGNGEPFFSDLLVNFDANGQTTLIGRDGWGNEQWRLALLQNSGYLNQAWTYARVNGRLLLLSLGSKIAAIDALRSGADGGPRLLWSRNLLGPDNDSAGLAAIPGRIVNLRLQRALFQRVFQSYGGSGPLGPLRNRYVCYQRLRSLVAADPQSGATLWVRHDLPPGSELFGDDEYLFVVSGHREEAMLLRAADGELLGTRKIPRWANPQVLSGGEERAVFRRLDESYLATLGRRLLEFRRKGTQNELALLDPLDGRDLWPRQKFSAAARACVVGDEAVGVMEPSVVDPKGKEPSSRFLLLSLPDGRTIADVRLKRETSLSEITLLRSGDQYFLLTHSGDGSSLPMSQVANIPAKMVLRGNLYAMDLQGRLQWPAPVAVKSQYLLLHQPACLPILSFVCHSYQRTFRGMEPKSTVLCIDKRNGRTVYAASSSDATSQFLVTGDAEKKTVDLAMQTETITLKFTDDALPSASPAGKSAESPAGGETVRALFDAVQRTIGEIIEGFGQEHDQ